MYIDTGKNTHNYLALLSNNIRNTSQKITSSYLLGKYTFMHYTKKTQHH